MRRKKQELYTYKSGADVKAVVAFRFCVLRGSSSLRATSNGFKFSSYGCFQIMKQPKQLSI